MEDWEAVIRVNLIGLDQIIRFTIFSISLAVGFPGLNWVCTLFKVPVTMVSMCSSW